MPRTACDSHMDVEPSFDDYLRSRRWTCCNQAGGNPGCNWGRHQLRQQHAVLAEGPRTGGADFPTARSSLKRRNTDDSDSDSGVEDRFDGRGSAALHGSGFRPGLKLRRIDRASPDDMSAGPDVPGLTHSSASFFSNPSQR